MRKLNIRHDYTLTYSMVLYIGIRHSEIRHTVAFLQGFGRHQQQNKKSRNTAFHGVIPTLINLSRELI